MRITHITIQTADFEKEINFYEKYCRMTIQNDMRHMGRNIVFLSRSKGDTEIEIIENSNAGYSGNDNMSIGLLSENLNELHETLSSDGFQPTAIISPMPYVKFFFVKDPAGVNVQFM